MNDGTLFSLQNTRNADTWMNLEVSQTQKDKCHIISYEIPRIVKFTETENRMKLTRGWG